MKVVFFLMLSLFIGFQSLAQSQIKANKDSKFAIVIHGGAGSMTKENVSPALEKQYKESLRQALTVGYNILVRGGMAIDAVEAIIITLENDSLFNAGKGAVFTKEGVNELDASIMDGKTLKAGAVAGVRTIKNPISAAKEVMAWTPHVMLTGRGAEDFATQRHLSIVSPSYFYTDKAWRAYLSAKKKDSLQQLQQKKSVVPAGNSYDIKYGTVGAVVMDMSGNLAAGTSTGGMTYKMAGRVGDSPIIGAGTYADNTTCAVSCTGMGEYFIRLGVAKAVSDKLAMTNASLDEAVNEIIHKKLKDLGGEGGIIAVDKDGNVSMSFNTAGMIRGFVKANGEMDVKLFKE